jgi:hypothetical protein
MGIHINNASKEKKKQQQDDLCRMNSSRVKFTTQSNVTEFANLQVLFLHSIVQNFIQLPMKTMPQNLSKKCKRSSGALWLSLLA